MTRYESLIQALGNTPLVGLQRLSPRFYVRTRMGDIMSRINNDIGEIQRIAAETALAWVGNVLFLLGTTAMLAWLERPGWGRSAIFGVALGASILSKFSVLVFFPAAAAVQRRPRPSETRSQFHQR